MKNKITITFEQIINNSNDRLEYSESFDTYIFTNLSSEEKAKKLEYIQKNANDYFANQRRINSTFNDGDFVSAWRHTKQKCVHCVVIQQYGDQSRVREFGEDDSFYAPNNTITKLQKIVEK